MRHALGVNDGPSDPEDDEVDRVERFVSEVVAWELALGMGMGRELRDMPSLIADELMRSRGLDIRGTASLEDSPAEDALPWPWPVVRRVTHNEVTDTAHVELGNFNHSAMMPSIPHQVLEFRTPDAGRILVRLEDGDRIGRIEIWPASRLLPRDVWSEFTEELDTDGEPEGVVVPDSALLDRPQVQIDVHVTLPDRDDRVVELRATHDEGTDIPAKIYRDGDRLMISILGQPGGTPRQYTVNQFLRAIVQATGVLTEAPTPSA